MVSKITYCVALVLSKKKLFLSIQGNKGYIGFNVRFYVMIARMVDFRFSMGTTN
jgi:hypothetical protein